MSNSDDPLPSSRPADAQKVLTSGVPMGRWKEGQLFDGISPTPDRSIVVNKTAPARRRPENRSYAPTGNRCQQAHCRRTEPRVPVLETWLELDAQ
jgi:hypothetical protein